VITDSCQRWTEKRESRRPAGELFDPRGHDVEPIDTTTARTFIEAHHYSGTMSPPSYRHGLFDHGKLVGVAVFGVAPSMAAHRAVFGELTLHQGVTLGRLVLLDHVLGNGETWFLARCFALLRAAGVVAVESCADPQPRPALDGTLTHRGHVGTIYQALSSCGRSSRYVGRTNAASLRLLPDGTCWSNRAAGKVARREQGCDYAAAQLVRWGADPLREDEDALAWVRRWRDQLTRPMRHNGNHRYVWAINKRFSRMFDHMPDYAYPKIGGAS
jgi:hypothetical protein